MAEKAEKTSKPAKQAKAPKQAKASKAVKAPRAKKVSIKESATPAVRTDAGERMGFLKDYLVGLSQARAQGAFPELDTAILRCIARLELVAEEVQPLPVKEEPAPETVEQEEEQEEEEELVQAPAAPEPAPVQAMPAPIPFNPAVPVGGV